MSEPLSDWAKDVLKLMVRKPHHASQVHYPLLLEYKARGLVEEAEIPASAGKKARGLGGLLTVTEAGKKEIGL